MIGVEDRLLLGRGHTDAAVADLDRQAVATDAAAHQDAAPRRVFYRIRQEVAQHLPKELRIGPHPGPGRHHPQLQPLQLAQRREFLGKICHEGGNRDGPHLRAHDAGLDAVQVQQRVQHLGHRLQRAVHQRRQPQRLGAAPAAGHQLVQQRQRLQRLAKIVARGGEEPRLCRRRAVGLAPGGDQFRMRPFVLGDVDEGDHHAFDAPAIGAIGLDPAQIPDAPGAGDLALDRSCRRQHRGRVGRQVRVA